MRVRRSFRLAVLVALTVTSLAAPTTAARPDRSPGRAVDGALIATLPAGARVTRERGSGLVRSIRSSVRPLATVRELGGPTGPAAAGRAFLARHGGLFDIRSPDRDLRVAGVRRSGGAGASVHYQQLVDGVPVLGGDLVVVLDRRLDVRAVRGETTRDQTVDMRPAIAPGTAMRVARDAVARRTGASASGLRAAPPTRWILDPRLLGGPGLPYARLVWRTRVTDATATVDEFVAVDARTGHVALRFDQLRAGAPPETAGQRICDQLGRRENVTDRLPCKAAAALTMPYVDEALTVAQATEATHDFFASRFGYDLPADVDPAALLISTIRYCPRPAGGDCPYRNAFWSGSQMVYGAGFGSADDVVAHELGHAATEHASDLFYYMESGAINEALSDIFGESVDQTSDLPFDTDTAGTRWKLGEDLPASVGIIRNMQDPTVFGHPDRVDSPLWDDDPQETDGGGVHSNSGVANKAFYLMVDGSARLDETDRDVAFDQALAIWYLAASQLLTTASDYADLADSLQIACAQLQGVADGVRDGSGAVSEPIAPGDCTLVAGAIATTAMTFDRKTSFGPRTPRCTDPDATAVPISRQAFDASGTGWTFDATDAGRRWSIWDGYGYRDPEGAPGDPTWHLFGADLSTVADRRVRQTNAVAIPDGDRPVFLWFRHAFGFDDGSEDVDPTARMYDGGVIEVSADGGPFRDIGALLVSGRYGPAIWKGDRNPLKGRRAFVGDSGGYTMTRANLSGIPSLSFAGTNARLSFRIGTDSAYGGEGWFIDDVWIYTCVNEAESTPPSLSDLRVLLGRGTMSTDGRLPGLVSADVTGDRHTAIRVRVRVGTGPVTTFGGSVVSSQATGTFQASAETQEVSVTAIDENGDEATLQAETRLRRFEETGATYAGAWATRSSSSLSGGTARFASARGRTATFTIPDARQVAAVFTTGPDRGYVRVCVDGAQCERIDLHSLTRKPRRIPRMWAYPAAADRTLTVTVLGAKRSASSGTTVELDGFVAVTD